MRLHLIALCIILCLTLSVSAHDLFYYNSGEIVPLRIDSTKILVRFNSEVTPDDQSLTILEFDRIIEKIDDSTTLDYFNTLTLSTSENYLQFLDSLTALDEIYLARPYYISEMGYPVSYGVSFCVGFDVSLSRSEIDNIIAPYNISIQRELIGMPNVFVLDNSDLSGYSVLDLANIFHEMPETYFAQPDFSMTVEKNSYMLYDLFHTNQPHIKKVIGDFNNATVWDFAGLDDTIIVAVFDDGITAHDDLPASRILPGFDIAGPLLSLYGAT